jgi:hypothetical protein
MGRKMFWQASVVLFLCLAAVGSRRASAAVVMNYGADGNDYFQFTTPSMSRCRKPGT